MVIYHVRHSLLKYNVKAAGADATVTALLLEMLIKQMPLIEADNTTLSAIRIGNKARAPRL